MSSESSLQAPAARCDPRQGLARVDGLDCVHSNSIATAAAAPRRPASVRTRLRRLLGSRMSRRSPLRAVAVLLLAVRGSHSACPTDRPPVWPSSFTLVQRRIPDNATAGPALASTVTYYDWDVAKANLIVITPDANASDVLWDLELDSGHSYYYSPGRRTCDAIRMPVGILRPDWLANATSLGRRTVNGRAVVAWTKADFIDYYADAETCDPVSWYFHGMKARFDTIFWAPNLRAPSAAYFAPPDLCSNETSG